MVSDRTTRCPLLSLENSKNVYFHEFVYSVSKLILSPVNCITWYFLHLRQHREKFTNSSELFIELMVIYFCVHFDPIEWTRAIGCVKALFALRTRQFKNQTALRIFHKKQIFQTWINENFFLTEFHKNPRTKSMI